MTDQAGSSGGEASAWPPHVQRLAESHSAHLAEVVQEAQAAEDQRARLARTLPPKVRPEFERKFERERAQDVQRITRLREEQKLVLAATLRGDNPLHNGTDQYVESALFNKGLPKPPEQMLNGELIFQKECINKFNGKTDGQLAAVVRRRRHVSHQRSHDTKLASSRTEFGRRPRDRRDLLVEKRALMQRLHDCVAEEHRMATVEAALLPTAHALDSDRVSVTSSRTASTARSNITRSTATSGATFCDRSAPVKWKNTIPSTVHPLW